MPENPLACLTHDAINNRFVTATGVITDLYFKQNVCLDPWRSRFKQREFPLGQGTNPSYVKLFRTIPYQDLEMLPLGLSSCDSSFDGQNPYSGCDPGYINLPLMGQLLKQMTIYRSPRIRTPEICLLDLQLSHDPTSMIDAQIDNLTFATSWYWSELTLKNLIDGIYNQWVIQPYSDGSIPEGKGTLPQIEATQHITVGVLDRITQQLMYKGVGCSDGNGCNQPVFDFYIGGESANNMIRQDPVLRQDMRFSDDANTLLGGMNAFKCKEYHGYKFNYVAYPPRFNFVGGEYVRVLPFGPGIPVTIGPDQEVTAEYEAALYESAFVIPTPDVMQWLVPPLQLRFNKVTFGGQGTPNYAGDFAWLNYQTDCNTDKSKGFFEAQFLVGWDFPFPEYGFFIVFKRCFTPIGPFNCSPTGVPSCTPTVLPSPPSPASPPTPWVDPCVTVP
jgi:hypothetical protein